MRCNLTSADGYPIRFLKQIPTILTSDHVPAVRRYAARYKKGIMLFQCVEEDSDCSLWHNVFRLYDTDTIKSSCRYPTVALRVSLSGLLRFKAGTLGDIELAPRQALLFYLPEPSNELYLKGGKEYIFFDFLLPEKYIEHFLPYYSILPAFAEKIADRTEASLTSFPIRLSATGLHCIDMLLNCTYKGSLRSMYIDARIMDIMTEVLSLAEGSSKREVILTDEEVNRIQEIRKLLGKNLHKHYRIKDLSRMAYINEYKLKRGFQQVVGASIFDYQLNHRMQEARLNLSNTEMSLEEIAEATGYQYVSSFISAFRQHFGMTPTVFRKQRRR
ncbi:helix-turn-helix transcriptional regulator [Chitinophaga oryzae]|uniref:Helix-turn-helix transcriptional regulator n=1 Tax=Chitinophaga oryzae TaxID=2725414 RepID=A0AAE6ZDB2_9BACT|nr:AraC family transcriptional regulator [Chitinophaga oryzae]QJB29905.1 helix-turn-helix transcriptional regulator [Chitinophaga oryzae]